MSNYSATVVKIENLRPHENADRLVCTNLFGNNVIVSKDMQIGDIGLFFPVESQLSEAFATANDLIRRKDENGKTAGGMFDSNRRVRAQKFRGENSCGFFIPLDSLNKTFESVGKKCPEVEIGEEFEELDGIQICKKYTIPTKCQSINGKKSCKKPKESRLVDGQFHFHFDTSQLGKNIHKISPDSLISVTFKMHGTSSIVSNCLVKKNLKWHEKLLKFIGVNIVDTEYDYVYSSRKVVKNDSMKEHDHFYGEDLWTHAGEQFKGMLHKGETVYFEICGFTPSGKAIQGKYDYGCSTNQYKIYIYRITQTNIDGVITELPWHQVSHRSKELGQETAPEIYYGKAGNFYKFDSGITGGDIDHWRNLFFDFLKADYVYDQDSQFCKNKIPEEGIVVRVELGDGIENFKLKSFAFLGWESKQLDSGEADMESEESEEVE